MNKEKTLPYKMVKIYLSDIDFWKGKDDFEIRIQDDLKSHLNYFLWVITLPLILIITYPIILIKFLINRKNKK